MSARPEPPHVSSSRLARALLRTSVYGVAVVLLLGATVLAGIRFLLPNLQHFRPEIEGWVSRIVEHRVEIGTIAADWRGWTPVLRIGDVRLTGDDAESRSGTDASIRLAELEFSIDTLHSLRSGTWQSSRITVRGASFVVNRRSDGGLSIQGFEGPAPAEPRESGRLAPWLLSRPRISLISSRVLWIDEQHGAPALPLDEVVLHLDRDDDRHRISGSFDLPESGRVEFAMDVTGDLLAASWSGTVHVSASDVDVVPLGLAANRTRTAQWTGLVSGELWSRWSRARMLEAEGSLRARSPGIMDGGRWRGFEELSVSFRVEPTSDGWNVAARDLAVTTPNGSWPASSADATLIPPRDGRDGVLVVRAAHARIEDLAMLVSPAGGESVKPMRRHRLSGISASGILEDLHLSVPITDRVEFESAHGRGRFTELRFLSGAWPVSLDRSSGEFEVDERGMVADFTDGNVQLSHPSWFAEPVRGERLAGAVAVFATPNGARVRILDASLATRAGSLSMRGTVLAPGGEHGPEVDVTVDLGPSKISAVRALFADRMLPRPVSRWLDSAAPDGDVRSVRLRIRRDPSKPPVDSRGGPKIEVTAELALPVFRFAPGWPAVMEMSGVVHFDTRRIDARIDAGRVLGARIETSRITIEDLSAAVPVVHVAGRARGSSADAVRFLAESPLRTRFASVIDTIAIAGDSKIGIELTLPLKGTKRAVAVDGEVALNDNRLRIPGLDRPIETVTGVIAFGRDGVKSEGITATWNGEPLRAVVGVSPAMTKGTRVTLQGRLTRGLLAAYLHGAGLTDSARPFDSTVLARLDGEGTWHGILDIPHVRDAGEGMRLRIATDLAGVALDLPAPFDKPRRVARDLVIDYRNAPGVERVVEIRHESLASAALRFVPENDRYKLERGEIRLGSEPATLPAVPGVTVHGLLPALDTKDWLALHREFSAFASQPSETSSFDRLQTVSIDAGTATALGADFPDTRIRAARDGDGGWNIELAGRRLEGVVRVPRDLHSNPIVAEFEHIIVMPRPAGRRGERPGPDPRILPAMSLSARELVIGKFHLGAVSVSTAPSETGMQFEEIDVETSTFVASATGRWSLDGTVHRTEFDIRIHSDDLGLMLDSLGIGGNVLTGGATDVALRGSWDGTPADFALKRLRGVMHVHSSDGVVTQIHRGLMARVFGLFAVTSLPRRLILDFSDIFEDGVEYDVTEGTFAIENGHAYTEDLFMESSTARIEVVGRTGLLREDYDKLVTIVPKISTVLPFVPIWLAQKLLDRDGFDRAFSHQYTVTGTWDKPVVDLVSRQNDE